MKVHSFDTNIVAWAVEKYMTIDKYKDNANMNQYEKIWAQHEMQRLKKIHEEFTNEALVIDAEMRSELEN